MSAYDIQAWLEFGVAVAGAAAVLTGLVFVSVSINRASARTPFSTANRRAVTTCT